MDDFHDESFQQNVSSSAFLAELCTATEEAHIREKIKTCIHDLGADIYAYDDSSLTALHYAAKAGNVQAAGILLEYAGAGISDERVRHSSQLRLACLRSPLHNGATALHWAAAYSADVLEVLLRNLADGPPSNAPSPSPNPSACVSQSSSPWDALDYCRQTLLHYAASGDNTKSLGLLLPRFSQYQGVDVCDAVGLTPLNCAVTKGCEAAARRLLEAGAGLVRTPQSGWSPFHHAAMYNQPEMLRLLYKHAVAVSGGPRGALAELNAADTADGTPLRVAVKYGCLEAVKALLELGATAELLDAGGATPLHLAASLGRADVVTLLEVKQQGKVETPDGRGMRKKHLEQPPRPLFDMHGWAAAHLAAASNSVGVLKALAAAGHDMNVRAKRTQTSPYGREGWTPLHCAVASGSLEAVQALLEELGADPLATSAAGATPSDLVAGPHGISGHHLGAASAAAEEGQVEAGWRPEDSPAEEVAKQIVEIFLQRLHMPPSADSSRAGSSRDLQVPEGVVMNTPRPPAASGATPCPPLSAAGPGLAMFALPPLPNSPPTAAAAGVRRSPFALLAQQRQAPSLPSSPPPPPSDQERQQQQQQQQSILLQQSHPFPIPGALPAASPSTPQRVVPASGSAAAEVAAATADSAATPPTCGSDNPPLGYSPLVTLMNSPWGFSTLNRAILYGPSKVADMLLGTLPRRSPTVRLVARRGEAVLASDDTRSDPSGGAGVAAQRKQQQYRAVVEDLGLDLKSLNLAGTAVENTYLMRRLGRLPMELGLRPNRLDSTARTAAAASPSEGSPACAAADDATAQATPLSPALRDLLAPPNPQQDVHGPLVLAVNGWWCWQCTESNRSRAAWLAAAPEPEALRGWVCLELHVTAPQGATTGQVWLGLGWLGRREADRGDGVAAGDSVHTPNGVGRSGVSCGWEECSSSSSSSSSSCGGGGGVVGCLPSSLSSLWACVTEGGLPAGAVAVADVVLGELVTRAGGIAGKDSGAGGAGAAGGSGSWTRRRERRLALPEAGGSAVILWDVLGGSLLAVVNGGVPVLLAEDLDRAPNLPPSAASLASATPSAQPQLQLQSSQSLALLMGCQAPGYCVRVRFGGMGMSGQCSCVDDLLVAAQEARQRSDALWPSKAVSMNSLHFAAWVGKTWVLSHLICEKGFQPDEPDGDGWTALHFAALAGQAEAVGLLLEHGGHAEVHTHHGRTPSMMAAASPLAAPGSADKVLKCLELLAGCDPNVLEVKDERGRTLLMLAARVGHVQVVEWLLRQGLDPAAVDLDGRKTLQYASEHQTVYDILEEALRRSQARDTAVARAGAALGVRPSGEAGKGPHGNGRDNGILCQHQSNGGDIGSNGGDRTNQAAAGRSGVPTLQPWQWVVEPLGLNLDSNISTGAFGQILGGTYYGCKVAVKLLRPGLSSHHQATLEKELNILQSLFPHDRIASFIGAMKLEDGRCGLVMSRYHTNLHNAFQDKSRLLSPKSRFIIARQIAEALRFLHNLRIPIIHRDLKPDNVLLTEKFDVKLCDFGLSQVLYSDAPISSTGGYGHPLWMAPEVLRGEKYNVKADVWSWGVIFYQLATWVDEQLLSDVMPAVVWYQLSLPGASKLLFLDRLPSHVAAEVADLLGSCLKEDPTLRPDINTVLERLNGLKCKELPGPGGPGGPGPPGALPPAGVNRSPPAIV